MASWLCSVFWPPLAPFASRRGVYELSPPNPELEDLTLFHRAILASTTSSNSRTVHSRLGTATNPKPKIAFLFLTNSDLSFAPLWNKFFNTTTNNKHLYDIYIHTDPLVTIAPPGGVFQGRFITEAKKTERGSPSLIFAACPLCLTLLSPSLSLTPLPLPSDCSLPLGHSHFVFLDLSISVSISHGLASHRCLSLSLSWYFIICQTFANIFSEDLISMC
uniref:Uncharacterized protein n=1 Tax=Fagus sylvatica TaxID=28930 RepID=A0A2N9G1Y5_FAGSY